MLTDTRMFKIVFLAVLALQAVFAHDHRHETQELLEHVRSVSHDAVNAIQKVPIRDHRVIHALYSEAHELAHNVHEVAYHLQQIVHHDINRDGRQILDGVVMSLYDIVHAIHRAMHHEPSQVQALLRVEIEHLVAEAGKLGSIVQQLQGSEDVGDELLVVLDDLLVAIQQFHVRTRIQYENPQDIKQSAKTIVDQVSKTIEHVNAKADKVIEKLVHHCHHLAHHLGDIIRKLERESHYHHGEVRDVLIQVVNKISEIRSSLERVDRDCSVDSLQHQLYVCVREVVDQIERLIQIVHSDKLDEHESHNLKDVVHSVLAHVLAAERQLQRNIAQLSEHVVEGLKHDEYHGVRHAGFEGLKHDEYQGVRHAGFEGLRNGEYHGPRRAGFEGLHHGEYQGVHHGDFHGLGHDEYRDLHRGDYHGLHHDEHHLEHEIGHHDEHHYERELDH